MPDALILVVEDNDDIREFIEESLLDPSGYRVKSVQHGLEALDVLASTTPDLVITDYHMPKLNGLELLQHIQQRIPGLPVIMMSSEHSNMLVVEAMRSGASDFLVKPFDQDALMRSVHAALEQKPSLPHTPTRPRGTPVSRVRELETLIELGRAITEVLGLDEALTRVVEAAVHLTGAEEGSLLLLDKKSGNLFMRASKNFDEDFVKTFWLHVRDSLAGQVIETGKPILLDESSPQKIKTAYLVHSLIYVPLRVRGKIIGVLGVDNRKAGRVLGQNDVTVMTAMADYAAIAIDNARLFKQSEDERTKLETILAQTENGVIVVDEDNRVVMINRSAEKIFGVAGKYEGLSTAEVFDHDHLLEFLRSSDGMPRREELELEDGRIFSVVRSPIKDVGQAVVLHDITHFKELDRIKSEFVTTVSHDLRSPLTAILGYLELIDRAGPLNKTQLDFVERVRISVEQITALVTDLLDLGRIESGLDTSKEKANLGSLARYALDGLRSTARNHRIDLRGQVEDPLPEIYGDPVRLRQMIANLLENAIKYTPEGGEVKLEASAEDDQVILKVSDTGPGIPPSDQPYLFDKFFRASNVPDDSTGTGLGLSIVKSIVEQHQGRIWLDSEIGIGTTFTVVLPAITE
ncbi:MAG: ATP-binding protein [Anaerolineales bacterium]|jgi:two-component system NtrC family sensor kinase